MAAGKPLGIQPFGVEAQRILRLEKAHVIIGQDTDGLTHPLEAGMNWAVKMDKPYFIGQRSLGILAGKPQTRRLAGFALSKDYSGPLPKECHLVIDREDIEGRVTSVTHSPTLDRVIGMAYVSPAHSRPGTVIHIRVDGGEMIQASIVATPFYDPEGQRQIDVPVLQGVS